MEAGGGFRHGAAYPVRFFGLYTGYQDLALAAMYDCGSAAHDSVFISLLKRELERCCLLRAIFLYYCGVCSIFGMAVISVFFLKTGRKSGFLFGAVNDIWSNLCDNLAAFKASENA